MGDAAAIIARGCNGFIQKPFGMEKLSHAIREVIDNGRHQPTA
jgi:two-component system cell cycle sensor histidine kinase/response regulator CckA